MGIDMESFRDTKALLHQAASERFDTRELLAHAAAQSQARHYGDFLIVDVDAHHYENESFAEITDYIENPIIQKMSRGALLKGGGQSGLVNTQVGDQDMGGRVSRYYLRRQEQVEPGAHRDVTLVHRVMDSMGVDYTVLFPTPMLFLGMHPLVEVEVAVARAYARWMTERILEASPRIKTMLYLPFNDPEASLRMIEEFSDHPGVVGYMVTSVRHAPVYHNSYMKVYRALEERGLPIGFHAAYEWDSGASRSMNKFISVHALGFTFYNIIHLTNVIMNGLPERFPQLKFIWIESGLAWIPFLMQRLDNEYMMRSSEAPLLKKLPSDYMRDFYYTSQPLERVGNDEILELTFRMMNAENRLLFSSDYPHWDFDLPSQIYDLPFLTETAKRKILGENARTLFRL